LLTSRELLVDCFSGVSWKRQPRGGRVDDVRVPHVVCCRSRPPTATNAATCSRSLPARRRRRRQQVRVTSSACCRRCRARSSSTADRRRNAEVAPPTRHTGLRPLLMRSVAVVRTM